MRGWWQEMTDLVLPVDCAGCGRPGGTLCDRCGGVLRGSGPRRVEPSPVPPGLPVVHAAAEYADEVRAVLLAHKERGALRLAGPLGEALAGAVRTVCHRAGRPRGRPLPGGSVRAGPVRAPEGPLLLVPVPSARRAVGARGHDPARRIALAAAGVLRGEGCSVRVPSVLRQRRTVRDQSGLGARQRLVNVSGALGVVPGGGRLLSRGPAVLVDDLMTTGASLAEAARAVSAADGLVVGAAVVAAPPDCSNRN
ncbi:ComF family protein [Streptomyces sp. NA02950]|uniref:ComF family protein n=1 Tax=Streptomyces sp. NA02950 TaxID=2742137 RepID=UPI001590A216|nr:ComF family protein [Streptomyces sp. NA02950]QKV94624.1 ComF family protein [Streptomyces sp. NA02950]